MKVKKEVYTIGHSTRTIAEFITILKKYEINLVIDIRLMPRSRNNPQFNADLLASELKKYDIDYLHLKELTGFRKPQELAINDGWLNKSFRAFADYMQTQDFGNGIEQIIKLMGTNNIVLMCAELLPWRCHRSLIADALIIRGIEVIDIFNNKITKAHRLTPWAKVDGLDITYPKK